MPTIFRVQPVTTNVGNDLIALAADRLLATAFGDGVTLVNVPAAGGTGPKAGGLSARNVYAMNHLADAVLVGGGNLFENGGVEIDPTAMAALTVPFGVVGVSSGRVHDRRGTLRPRTDALSHARLRAVCDQAEPLLVRDQATFDHLRDLGVSHVTLTGCPTLSLAATLDDARPLDPSLAGVTLLSVRAPTLMSVSPARQDQVRGDVRALLEQFEDQGRPVELLCHDYQDLAFAQAYEGVPIRYTEDARTVLSWLRSCDVSVGYRLHGFLAALAMDTPAVHVSYDERGAGMLDTIGLADWDLSMFEVDDIPGAVAERLADLPRLRALQEAAIPRVAALRDAMATELERFAARVCATAASARPEAVR